MADRMIAMLICAVLGLGLILFLALAEPAWCDSCVAPMCYGSGCPRGCVCIVPPGEHWGWCNVVG